MNLKSKILSAIFFITGVTVLVITAEIFFHARSATLIARQQHSHRLVMTLFELNNITLELVLADNQNRREHWLEKHKLLTHLLEQPPSSQLLNADFETITEMSKAYGADFETYTASRAFTNNSRQPSEIKNRFLMRAQVLMAQMLGLEQKAQQAALSGGGRFTTIAAPALCLFVMATAVGFFLLCRRMDNRFTILVKNVRAVLQGRNDIWFDTEEKDNVSELAGLLNEVTNELRHAHLSFEQEVVAHKQTKTELKTCQLQFNGLTNHIEAVFWIFSPDWMQALYVSPAYETIWGRSCQEIYRQSFDWFDAILEDDRPRIRDLLDQKLGDETKIITFPEYRIQHTDGSVRWIEDRRFPVSEGKCIVHVFGIARDITSRKKTDAATQSGDEKFRQLADVTPSAISIVRGEQILYVNPGWEKLTDYRADEIKHLNMFDLVHPDMRAQVQAYSAARLKGEVVPERYELKIADKEGRVKWCDMTATRISYQGGSAALCVAVDITVRKQLEKQIHFSQKMEAIGTLAGGIAHDFNNILASIMGYAELALDEAPIDSQLEENLKEIMIGSQRAKELVQQILTFSRQGDQIKKPVQMALLVQEALKLLRATIPSTITIATNIDSRAVVEGDPTQLHQVIMNLCTNASYAMSATGGRLEVMLREVELDSDFCARHPNCKPGRHILLTVSDTGAGMTADILSRIFDPFFTTKPLNEGTGMGLAVVHGIVVSHGGTVYPYSEPGRGSTFKVFLPTINKPFVHKKSEKALKPLPMGSERILLVDDERQLVRMGQQTLSSLGYDVITRTSSLEALELFRVKHQKIDLVITDMTMPNMTGEELAAAMMAIRPDVPIILNTGFSSKIDERKAAAMGIRAFVNKPATRRELADTVRRVLDRKKGPSNTHAASNQAGQDARDGPMRS